MLDAARQHGSKHSCVSCQVDVDRIGAEALQPYTMTATATSATVTVWQDPQQADA